ncbi:MAG: hypothetical protein DSZ27_07135 [Thiomicrospira sp.]|nr:MAG: hypothetical protein DSZ27_07135 [Thiomicrospira sp.]
MIYLQEQLSKMSDLEINMAVAKKAYRTEGFDTEFPKVFSDKSSVGWLWLSKVSPAYQTCGIGFFRPCENWNDIMPIAKENKISLTWCDDGDALVTDSIIDLECGFECIEVKSNNPERAICEVFLMMDIGKE